MTPHEAELGREGMDLRKINVLVAEKVMGWRQHFRNTADWTDVEKAYDLDYPVHANWRWRPTEDPVAAKQVRQKLAGSFAWRLFYNGPEEFQMRLEAMDEAFEAVAATEELATCLCALQAFGVKI